MVAACTWALNPILHAKALDNEICEQLLGSISTAILKQLMHKSPEMKTLWELRVNPVPHTRPHTPKALKV